MSKIVIALGGNALGKTPKEQLSLLEKVSNIIVELVADGNQIVLTHGNGPQVGQIALAMEYASNGEVKTPAMPFAECGSMSQGYIGYQLQQSLDNELNNKNINKSCVSIVTQVLVDEKDTAFQNPTKPIGMFYSEDEAMKIQGEKGFQFVEDAGRGYRRVVPSPIPQSIIEKKVIDLLLNNNNIVIAVGGGGIPVVESNGKLKGVEAVIDKDRSAALLAREIDADILLILTAVDKVCIHFNKENETALDSLSINEAIKYIQDNEFAKGSMLPKVEACIEFVKDSKNKKAIITSLENASGALKGINGTVIRN